MSIDKNQKSMDAIRDTRDFGTSKNFLSIILVFLVTLIVLLVIFIALLVQDFIHLRRRITSRVDAVRSIWCKHKRNSLTGNKVGCQLCWSAGLHHETADQQKMAVLFLQVNTLCYQDWNSADFVLGRKSKPVLLTWLMLAYKLLFLTYCLSCFSVRLAGGFQSKKGVGFSIRETFRLSGQFDFWRPQLRMRRSFRTSNSMLT